MFAITHKKALYIFSLVLLVVALGLVAVFGLKPGIDFTGGSLLELTYQTERPEQVALVELIQSTGIQKPIVRYSGEQGVVITMETLTQEQKEVLLSALSSVSGSSVTVERFTSIGPTLGKELAVKSFVALLLVVFTILLYVAYVFRKVTQPVSSWKYGFAAIISLAYNVLITIGVFALLGQLFGTEVDTLFVTALLVVLGYSVNDAIVVLDRVRENLALQPEEEREAQFVATVGHSITETIARSVSTGTATLIALLALVLFGSESTRMFSVALMVGILVGTYSSLCIAAPLLVSFFEHQPKRPQSTSTDTPVV